MSVDLAAILDATPRTTVEFDLSKVDIGKLTMLELLDAAAASSTDIEDFRANLFAPEKQAHLFYAIAWVIMRRQDKSLTFDQVCEFDMIMTGELPEEDEVAKRRARSLVAVASLAHVSPREAEDLTLNEVEATVELTQARNRNARRRVKR